MTEANHASIIENMKQAQKQKRPHVCDTETPQRPCCWAARVAWMNTLKAQESERKLATQQRDAETIANGGFIVKGID